MFFMLFLYLLIVGLYILILYLSGNGDCFFVLGGINDMIFFDILFLVGILINVVNFFEVLYILYVSMSVFVNLVIFFGIICL